MFINHNQESQKVIDKRMKHKVSLLTTALGNPGPEQQTAAPSWKKEKPEGDPHFAATSAPTAKKPAIGKMNALIIEEYLKSQKNFNPPRKGRYQPEPVIQELNGQAEEQSD